MTSCFQAHLSQVLLSLTTFFDLESQKSATTLKNPSTDGMRRPILRDMASDHRPVESERVGMRLNMPPVPMKVAGPESVKRSEPEVIHFPEPEEAPSPLRAFWEKHGIRYQPAPNPSHPTP